MSYRASVLIPTSGRPKYLEAALHSLFAQRFEGNWEIIVVDNSPQGDARVLIEKLTAKFSELRYLHQPRPGLHRARHAGARAAQSEILVYIDDDVIAPPDWLEAIAQPFAQDARVAIVGGPVHPRFEAANARPEIEPVLLSLLDLGAEKLELHWPAGVYGCNMAVRKTALLEVGGFNPDGMHDPELIWWRGDGETGLHQKIFAANWKVVYAPAARLEHQIPARRLQEEALKKRVFGQGISDSFSFARAHRSPLARLRYGLVAAARALKWSFIAFRAPSLQTKLPVALQRGILAHQARLWLNPALRRHVIKPDFWND